jgi:hypothetical protein
MGVPTFFGNVQQTLLWAVSRAARAEVTSGIHNRHNYCVSFAVYMHNI